MGAHLTRIHGARQSERTSEASVLALNATIVLFFLVFLQLALAVHGQRVAFDADIDILLVNARDFHLQSNGVLVFVDVHWRCEVGSGQRLFWAFGAERLTEKPVHSIQSVLQTGKLTDGLPTGH